MQMRLEDTELYTEFSECEAHTLANLGVAFVSLYLGLDNISSDGAQSFLQTPGCKTANVLVSGVANTTRHLLLLKDPKHHLLGRNAGFLSGTKETSIWTEIVEVTVPRELSSATNISAVHGALNFLEEILAAPFVGHNNRKIRQEAIKLGILPEHGLLSRDEWKAIPLFRRFIHGLHCGATDMLLFAMLTAKLTFLKCSVSDLECSELLAAYLERISEISSDVREKYLHIVRDIKIRDFVKKTSTENSNVISECKDSNNLEPDKEIAQSAAKDISMVSSEFPEFTYKELTDASLDWDLLDDMLKPQRNSQNNINKMHQLQSMLAGVALCINQLRSFTSEIRIVDFCSGGGHLGIFLAHHFPDCTVVLLDTKWGSLRYAKERIDKLGLQNTILCLASMGQFCGRFDLGVSLHACGTLTDIVIEHCLRVGAAIVSSPCCYGKISSSPTITYPKSKKLSQTISKSKDYYRICRLADHESENEEFMKCIDIDRIEHIKEHNYQLASISKLKPSTCSPKNNLIVAFK